MNIVIVEFYRSNGTEVMLVDLGPTFLLSNGVSADSAKRPFKIVINPKTSKAGNTYYEYSQNGIPFPDGLQTLIKVNGSLVSMGGIKPSQKGNPTREGVGSILLGDLVHDVMAYLTESKSGYYVKVVVHKQPDRSKAIQKALLAPRGGKII